MIAWVDTETTGLDENNGFLLEVAFVITDDNLAEKSAWSTVVLPPDGTDIDVLLNKMDPFVIDMHTRNRLIDDLRQAWKDGRSGYKDLHDLRKNIVTAFSSEPCVQSDRCAACKRTLSKHLWNCDTSEPKASCSSVVIPGSEQTMFTSQLSHPLSQTPMAGSTVSFDRRWMRKHAAMIEGLFSHRSIDVSTVTELAKRFAPDLYSARPRSTDTHRALADARGSIAVLKFYRDHGLFGIQK